MDLKKLAIVSAFTLGASFTAAQAATFEVLSFSNQGEADILGFGSPDDFGTNWGVAVSSSTVQEVGPGSQDGEFRSPWQGTDEDGVYFSVGGTNQPSPASVTFAESISSINLLIGSIDSYNSLVFDGHVITGQDIIDDILVELGDPTGVDNQEPEFVALVRFTADDNDGISNITFRSDQAALEFAVAPVPLPAAAWMLIAGIGGLGMMRRKQKS